MDTAREVEVKLGVPDGFVLPHLVEVGGVESVAVRSLRLRASYWDTADHRLAQAGMTLRHRTGEGRPRWTLKTASASHEALAREEISVVAAGTRVPEALVELLTARLRGAPLLALAQVRTLRTTSLLFNASGDEVAEVVDDVVTVLRKGVELDGWHELEVELRASGKAFRKVVEALREAGAGDVDQTPKGIRALGALGPPDLPAVPKARTAGDLVRGSLALGFRGIVERDLEVRREVPDGVHQLRVTCRRLRSDLRTFASRVADDRVELLRGELSWLASQLGAARDIEVLRERLHERAHDGDGLDVRPVDAVLAAHQQDAERAARAALRTDRYLALLSLLHEVAVAPVLAATAGERAKDVAPGLVAAARTKLDKALRALHADSPDDVWHRARIRAKRARYAAEAVGRPDKQAKRLQTRLGEHQDAVVAAARLLALAAEEPSLAVLCARLAERERIVALAVRRSFLG